MKDNKPEDGEAQSIHVYIEQVFRAADFLQYGASEEQLVDRVVMNFHPSILGQAAFLDRLRSRKDSYRVVGLIEEQFSVAKERQCSEQSAQPAHNSGVGPWDTSHVSSV